MEYAETKVFKNSLSKRIINTPTAIAKHTFFYLQETGIIKKDDWTSTQRENLDSYLIVAVTDGKGELTFNNQTFTVSKGECFFIDCRKPHHYESSSKAPWEIMWVHFNGSTSEQYYDYFINQSKNVFQPLSSEKLTSIISEIINVNEMQNTNSEIITSRLIVELLTFVLMTSSKKISCDTNLKQKLNSVYEYINENFSRDISLDELASKFFISKFYLTREFKKLYGKTIFEHIITVRINHGKELLRFSDKSIDEISLLCGFNDQSYFARQFKKAENITCFTYRKIWRD